MIKVIELFAGIGSQVEALKRANIDFESLGISEINPLSIEAYEMLHGKVNNFGDITKIEKLPDCDLLTYSFPCQDISNIGLRRGFEEDSKTRSSLLWQVLRLLDKFDNKPKFLLMENVKAIGNQHNIKNYLKLQHILEEKGYSNFRCVMNGIDYGIPQQREREIMLSVLNDNSMFFFPPKMTLTKHVRDIVEDRKDIPDNMYVDNHKEYFCMKNGKHKNCVTNIESNYVNTLTTKATNFAWTNFYIDNGIDNPDYVFEKKDFKDIYFYDKIIYDKFSFRTYTPKECFRLMGWEDYRIQPLLDKKWKKSLYGFLTGNSIIVNVLEELFKEMKTFYGL